MPELAPQLQEDVLERFLRYVRIDTTSDQDSETYPSTARQRDLGEVLERELRELGLDDERRAHELRLAAVDAVDVERRLGPGAVVEIVLRVRVEGRRTGFVEDLCPGRKLLQARDLDLAECRATDAQLIR